MCVLTQYKSHSLDRHVTTTWRMSALLGNYVTPVPAQQRLGPYWFTGSADAIYQSLNLINDERPDLVVVVGADHVYRMDPQQIIDQHVANGAGVTVAAIPVARHEASAIRGHRRRRGTGARSTPSWRSPQIRRPGPAAPMRPWPRWATTCSPPTCWSTRCARTPSNESSRHDIGGNLIPMLVRDGTAQVYDFTANKVPGAIPEDAAYWRDVGTLDAYFDAHMDLCAATPKFNLYNDRWPILTACPVPAAGEVRARRRRPGRPGDRQHGQ